VSRLVSHARQASMKRWVMNKSIMTRMTRIAANTQKVSRDTQKPVAPESFTAWLPVGRPCTATVAAV
jgi:hypothetical protein